MTETESSQRLTKKKRIGVGKTLRRRETMRSGLLRCMRRSRLTDLKILAASPRADRAAAAMPGAAPLSDQAKNNRLKAPGFQPWTKAPPVGCCSPVNGICCASSRTRPVSWLGSTSLGTHPCTKGARCSTGGHRQRIPTTRRVSSRLAAAQARKPPGDPSPSTESTGSTQPRRARSVKERPSRLACA